MKYKELISARDGISAVLHDSFIVIKCSASILQSGGELQHS
jgi:hypothetical protein